MGNLLVKYSWGLIFSGSVCYSIFYVIRDYKKKHIKKINQINNGDKISIEGRVRLMN